MKVMSISSEWYIVNPPDIRFLFFRFPGKPVKSNGPAYSEICTVVMYSRIGGRDYYVLKEYLEGPDGKIDYYDANCFIPLSEIDETEMIRDEIKTKA